MSRRTESQHQTTAAAAGNKSIKHKRKMKRRKKRKKKLKSHAGKDDTKTTINTSNEDKNKTPGKVKTRANISVANNNCVNVEEEKKISAGTVLTKDKRQMKRTRKSKKKLKSRGEKDEMQKIINISNEDKNKTFDAQTKTNTIVINNNCVDVEEEEKLLLGIQLAIQNTKENEKGSSQSFAYDASQTLSTPINTSTIIEKPVEQKSSQLIGISICDDKRKKKSKKEKKKSKKKDKRKDKKKSKNKKGKHDEGKDENSKEKNDNHVEPGVSNSTLIVIGDGNGHQENSALIVIDDNDDHQDENVDHLCRNTEKESDKRIQSLDSAKRREFIDEASTSTLLNVACSNSCNDIQMTRKGGDSPGIRIEDQLANTTCRNSFERNGSVSSNDPILSTNTIITSDRNILSLSSDSDDDYGPRLWKRQRLSRLVEQKVILSETDDDENNYDDDNSSIHIPRCPDKETVKKPRNSKFKLLHEQTVYDREDFLHLPKRQRRKAAILALQSRRKALQNNVPSPVEKKIKEKSAFEDSSDDNDDINKNKMILRQSKRNQGKIGRCRDNQSDGLTEDDYEEAEFTDSEGELLKRSGVATQKKKINKIASNFSETCQSEGSSIGNEKKKSLPAVVQKSYAVGTRRSSRLAAQSDVLKKQTIESTNCNAADSYSDNNSKDDSDEDELIVYTDEEENGIDLMGEESSSNSSNEDGDTSDYSVDLNNAAEVNEDNAISEEHFSSDSSGHINHAALNFQMEMTEINEKNDKEDILSALGANRKLEMREAFDIWLEDLAKQAEQNLKDLLLEQNLKFGNDNSLKKKTRLGYLLSKTSPNGTGNINSDRYVSGTRQYCAAVMVERPLCTHRESTLASMAWKPEFRNDLVSKPIFRSYPLSDAMIRFNPQCGACGRVNHSAKYEIQLCGPSYDALRTWECEKRFRHTDWLRCMRSRTSATSHGNCDQGGSFNHLPKDTKEENGVVLFKVGDRCRERTELYHALLHYKYRTMNRLQNLLIGKKAATQSNGNNKTGKKSAIVQYFSADRNHVCDGKVKIRRSGRLKLAKSVRKLLSDDDFKDEEFRRYNRLLKSAEESWTWSGQGAMQYENLTSRPPIWSDDELSDRAPSSQSSPLKKKRPKVK